MQLAVLQVPRRVGERAARAVHEQRLPPALCGSQ